VTTKRSSVGWIALTWMSIPALIGAFMTWTVTGRQLPTTATVVLPPLAALLLGLVLGTVAAATVARRFSLARAVTAQSMGAALGVAVLGGTILIGCEFILAFGPDAEWLPGLSWTSSPVADAVIVGTIWGGIAAAASGWCFARKILSRKRLEETRGRRLASGLRAAG
jgi:hypothetical protein